MIRVKQAILVEGKYDQNTLKQLVDTEVFVTNGFGVLNDREQIALLRRIAQKRGLIILTDSDGAGFLIRSKLKSMLPQENVLHAYIPDVGGKEKRKKTASKEGKLGVEGMAPEVLIGALRDCGAELDGETAEPKNAVTREDFYELSLSGGTDSAKKRKAVLKAANLPERMSTTAMLSAVRLLYDRDEFRKLCEESL